jgi:hypothetical protein
MKMEDDMKMIPINVAIMLPSIVLAIYVIPNIFGNVYVIPFIFLSILPIIKKLLPEPFSRNLYPVVAIVVLLIILLNIMLAGNIIASNWFFKLFIIPLNIQTAITLTMALSIASVFEGIFSKSLAKSIGYQTFSLLPLLDQVFVLYLMQKYSYTYIQAYYEAYSQQIISFIALVVTGSTNIFGQKFPPPLSEYTFPIDPAMLAALIISLVAIMAYFVIVKESKLKGEVLSGIASALVLGGVLGMIVFYLVQITSGSGFELFVAALALVVTLVYAARSSPERKARKKGTPK